MADNIKVLVDKEMEAIRQKSKLPITMLVGEYVLCRIGRRWHRFVCSSPSRSSSTSHPKPASRWGSPPGSLMSRSSFHILSLDYTHVHRLKIWTMRSGRRTVSSSNFSRSTSLHSSKLESNHHLSTFFFIVFFQHSWVISVEIRCLTTLSQSWSYLLSVITRMYENTTLFFGDIVGFTKLTAQRWRRSNCWQ